jgi:TonB-linked SusC/RagA family outer membrane protein
MNCKYLLLCLMLILSSLSIHAQQMHVKGNVSDGNGTPLIGVSVVVTSNKTGTTTDVSGNFELNVPSENTTLVFSYIGYETQKIRINGRRTLNVVMNEDNSQLDEVVVVGYGTQKKINMTGAVAQVDNKELKMAPSSNITQTLAGRLPGLVAYQRSGQPGLDGASLLVRGPGAGDASPLVVVDGVIYEWFPDIQNDDVESISILKDAATAAAYGLRASGGVIMVTTKRGVIQKPTITVNSSILLSQNTNFPKFLNGPDYAYWYNKAQEMDGVPEDQRRFTSEEIDRITNGDPKGDYANTDWFDLLFKDVAPTYNNNVSIRGGNEKLRFYASIGSYNQQGIIDNTSYKRYNFRSNLDAQVSKNIEMSLDLSGKVSTSKEPGLSAGMGDYATIFPQALMAYPFLPTHKDGLPVGSLNGDGEGNQNPLAARDLSGFNEARTASFDGRIKLTYKVPFLQGLKLSFTGSYNRDYTVRKIAQLAYQVNAFNQTTRTWEVQNAKHSKSGESVVEQYFADDENYTIMPSIEYNNIFGKHSVGGLLLFEYYHQYGTGMQTKKSGYTVTDIMDLTFGDTVDPNFTRGGHDIGKRAGGVMRLNYSYADKYLFEFTGRLDASPRLPKENRWGFFPAVSAGWRISQEDFFKEALPCFDNLKLRGSIGRLGSESGIPANSFISTASISKDPTVIYGQNAYKSFGVGNPPSTNLNWQVTDSYNIGLEGSLWRGLLGFEVDVFYMRTTGKLERLGSVFPPSLGGYHAAYENYSKHDNRGFELVLSHRNRIGDLNYFVKGNVSWARNRIIKMVEENHIPNYKRWTGQRMGQILGFVAEGLFQSEEEIKNSPVFGESLPGDIKLKDINGDGQITWDQDLTPIARSQTPEMMFGLNISADYKGFDMGMLWQGAAICDVSLCGIYAGGSDRDHTFYTKPFYADGNTPYYLVENSWRPDNPNAKYPRLGIKSRTNLGSASSWWIVDGAYLRLKSLQIGYTLPRSLTEKAGITKARIFATGGNLLTFSHLPHLDPEMPNVNQGYYPQQRTYEFGINVSF